MDLLQRGAISTKGYDPPDSEGEAINRFKVIIKLFSVQEDPCVMLGVTKDELVSLNRIFTFTHETISFSIDDSGANGVRVKRLAEQLWLKFCYNSEDPKKSRLALNS